MALLSLVQPSIKIFEYLVLVEYDFFGNCTFSGSSQIEKVDQCMSILLRCGENKDVVILYVNRFKLFSDYSMLKMDWN